jgi:hypothetical protein
VNALPLREFDLALMDEDGECRVFDQLTVYRRALLAVHGLDEDDDPGDGEGWLEAIGEMVLGRPPGDDPESAELLERFERIGDFFDSGLADVSELMALRERADGSPGRLLAPASKLEGVEAVKQRGRVVLFRGGAAMVVEARSVQRGPTRRARPRERSSPRRYRARASGAASRDGPESDLEPHLGEPANGGLLGVGASR